MCLCRGRFLKEVGQGLGLNSVAGGLSTTNYKTVGESTVGWGNHVFNTPPPMPSNPSSSWIRSQGSTTGV